jgi:formylglycine-generating enzyme required for sulfatase activity
MGSSDDASSEALRPRHRIALSSFLIAKYEVSEAEWNRIEWDASRENAPTDLPMVGVNWYGAMAFCVKLGLDLPSEAQWEYACLGPAGSSTSVAVTSAIANVLPEKGVAIPEYTPRGWFAPNQFGLYDMIGNVSEWCKDEFYAKAYERTPAGTPNPVCTCAPLLNDAWGVRRGGDRSSVAGIYTALFRAAGDRMLETHNCGLRPVYSLGAVETEVCRAVTGAPPTVGEFVAAPEKYGFIAKPTTSQERKYFAHLASDRVLTLVDPRDSKSEASDRAGSRGAPFLISAGGTSNYHWRRSMGGRLPVIGLDELEPILVFWDGATSYCAKYGLSLPTEVQLETASAEGMAGKFHAGAEWCRDEWLSLKPKEMAWYEYWRGDPCRLKVVRVFGQSAKDAQGLSVVSIGVRQSARANGPRKVGFRVAFDLR